MTASVPAHRDASAAAASVGRPSVVGLAIVAWTAWQARDLVAAWRHSPLDAGGGVAFAAWILPPIVMWLTVRNASPSPRQEIRETWGLYAAALFFSLVGAMADVHALAHVGLLLAVGGLLPMRAATLIWLACGAAWTPALTWRLAWLPPAVLFTGRIAVSSAAAALMLRSYGRLDAFVYRLGPRPGSPA